MPMPVSDPYCGLFFLKEEICDTSKVCCIFRSAYGITFYKFNLTKLQSSSTNISISRPFAQVQFRKCSDIL
jgi:hypothetical protein